MIGQMEKPADTVGAVPRALIGHGQTIFGRLRLHEIDRYDYVDSLMHDVKFDMSAAGLVRARRDFLEAGFEVVRGRRYDESKIQKRNGQRDRYATQFENEVRGQQAQLFGDCYRFLRLAGVVRAEAMAIGTALLEDFGVQLELPAGTVIDQEITAARSRLGDSGLTDYTRLSGEAVSALADSLRLDA